MNNKVKFKSGPDDYAFGKYVNKACQQRGKELVKEAIEDKKKKEDYGKKEIYQSAKEAATFLCNKAKGKIITIGRSYCCFECKYRITIRKIESPCKYCNNGEYFTRKEKRHVTTKKHKRKNNRSKV